MKCRRAYILIQMTNNLWMRDIWHRQSYSLPEDPGLEKSGNTGLCSSFTGSGL